VESLANKRKDKRQVRLTILFLGAMLGILVVAGGVAFAANADCSDTGHGWECQCPTNGGTCTGINKAGEGETLFGSHYNDTIYAYDGDDDIFGNFGDDTIKGGPGNDYIEGDEGNNDRCYGGRGTDTLGYGCEVATGFEKTIE
jgi:Ca2+-binding RTX toxin-like protein